MSAIADDTDPAPCPISEGDRFRTRSDTRLTVLDVIESDGRPLARIERERNDRTDVLRMPVRDVRRRVRRDCWTRLDR